VRDIVPAFVMTEFMGRNRNLQHCLSVAESRSPYVRRGEHHPMPARMQATAEDKRTAEDRSTRDYLETTRTFWQPYAERELTREDAREMAHNLPFASSLNGSCTNVCPVKINIHEQIYAWRRVLVNQHEVPFVKKAAMKAAGAPVVPARCLPRRDRHGRYGAALSFSA
jgi:L-lactate utilization protein LutB